MGSANEAVGSVLDLQLNPKSVLKLLVGLFVVLVLFYLAKKGADAAVPRLTAGFSKAGTALKNQVAAPASQAPTDPMAGGL